MEPNTIVSPGSIVMFTLRDNEPPSMAIVMRQWPDCSCELFVYHFESQHNFRAALPSQIEVLIDPRETLMLKARVEELEQWRRGDFINALVRPASFVHHSISYGAKLAANRELKSRAEDIANRIVEEAIAETKRVEESGGALDSTPKQTDETNRLALMQEALYGTKMEKINVESPLIDQIDEASYSDSEIEEALQGPVQHLQTVDGYSVEFPSAKSNYVIGVDLAELGSDRTVKTLHDLTQCAEDKMTVESTAEVPQAQPDPQPQSHWKGRHRR